MSFSYKQHAPIQFPIKYSIFFVNYTYYNWKNFTYHLNPNNIDPYLLNIDKMLK